ncbi:MAG: ABC transporter substrate-binding protein [Phycisphaerae bacterium]|nr:ABC transporter substrate-binding protein [Phycisphaerae bacterium]MDW8263532.1 ABC transporter substrate-binding protein [Phycisphaerales bacterium]
MIRFWCILGALLGCVLCGCDRPAREESGSDGKVTVTLQLNWKPEPQFGGFYAARLSGAYARHGLEVIIREGGAGAPTVDMLAAGTVPFAIVSADEIVVARARGKPVKALFAVYQTHPQGIMSRASRGFREIADVFRTAGTLAMEQGLPYSDFLKKKYGFEKLKIVPSPFGDLSVFRNDESYSMQCFVTSEPLAAARLGIETTTFLIADAGYNPYATVLATSDGYLAANPSVVRAMVRGTRQGWQQYLQDPGVANSEMGRLNPTMDSRTFAESAEAQKPLIEGGDAAVHGVGHMTESRWRALIDQLQELKVIESPLLPGDCFVEPARWFDPD